MIVGITGGISTGKSTAAAVIASRGVKICDCDEIAHFLTTYETSIITAIREHFGDQVFHEYGSLNRAALADIVFTDETEKKALERILHPPIKAWVRANVDLAEELEQPLVVVAPLLIEAGMTTDVDKLWVVTCSAENQLIRLCKRAVIDERNARTWIDAQMSLAEKEKYADHVLRNDGSIEDFKTEVGAAWDALVH
jgi:dephospho-CoA kinase